MIYVIQKHNNCNSTFMSENTLGCPKFTLFGITQSYPINISMYSGRVNTGHTYRTKQKTDRKILTKQIFLSTFVFDLLAGNFHSESCPHPLQEKLPYESLN